MIPTENDDMAEVRKMCLWVKNELGADNPRVHVHGGVLALHLPGSETYLSREIRDIGYADHWIGILIAFFMAGLA